MHRVNGIPVIEKDHTGPKVTIPLYDEVKGRDPAGLTRRLMTRRPRRFLLPDGRLAVRRMLRAFCGFWRRHGAAIVAAAVHPEHAPMTVLTTFIERIIEACGEGSLEWWDNYGPTCHELCFEYTKPDGTRATQRRVMDLRVEREGHRGCFSLGIGRLDRNLPRLRRKRGILVVIDTCRKIGSRAPELQEYRTPKGHLVLAVQV